MEYVLLAIATLASTTKALAWKKIGTGEQKGARLHLVNAVIFLVAAACVFFAGLCMKEISVPSGSTILLGVLYAVCSTLTQILYIRAMGMGEASITQLVYSLGILLPIAYGAIFLNETISPMQYVGVALVALALFFIANPKSSGKFSISWLIVSLLSACGSGAIAITQKIHQSSPVKEELQTFVFISLVCSSIFSILMYLVLHKKNVGSQEKMDKKFILFLIFCGLCIAILNLSTSMCAGLLPSVIQFPVYNIGSMVLLGVLGYFLMKERLTKSKLIGFGIGCIAILFIGLF